MDTFGALVLNEIIIILINNGTQKIKYINTTDNTKARREAYKERKRKKKTNMKRNIFIALDWLLWKRGEKNGFVCWLWYSCQWCVCVYIEYPAHYILHMLHNGLNLCLPMNWKRDDERCDRKRKKLKKKKPSLTNWICSSEIQLDCWVTKISLSPVFVCIQWRLLTVGRICIRANARNWDFKWLLLLLLFGKVEKLFNGFSVLSVQASTLRHKWMLGAKHNGRWEKNIYYWIQC